MIFLLGLFVQNSNDSHYPNLFCKLKHHNIIKEKKQEKVTNLAIYFMATFEKYNWKTSLLTKLQK